MKRLIPFAAIIFGCFAATPAAAAPLTTLRAIQTLGNRQADQAMLVDFEATVTYFRDYERTLFVQDGDDAIFVLPATSLKLLPGDRIRIRGLTQPSFRPYIESSDITLLAHGSPPKAVRASFRQLASAEFDCRRVKVRGTIVTADSAVTSLVHSSILRLFSGEGYVEATVDRPDPGNLPDMLDSEVEITGAVSGRFDGKMQQTGVLVHSTSFADLRVIKRAKTSPWSLPLTPMDGLLSHYSALHLSQRVRVHGTITYFQPSSAVVLQSGNSSVWIQTQTIAPLKIGAEADAIGYPDVVGGFVTIGSGEIRETAVFAPTLPAFSTWRDLTASKHGFDLVSIDGRVVSSIRKAAQDEYVLQADGYMFSAIYRHTGISDFPDPPVAQVPIGSTVRVTGICILEGSNPFEHEVPFNILLRSPSDISVLVQPSFLNVRNLTFLAGLLFAVVLAVGAKGWALEREVRRQTAALAARTEAEAALERRMAQLELRRSRILEDINGSRPLAEILDQILDLSSSCLDGAPCWCEINDGARFGSPPTTVAPLRIVCEPIPARAGGPLGTIFAAFGTRTKPAAAEAEALAVGARLATLAVETRLLYSDLLHRSEFDLLTDLHNRFSFDKHLEVEIGRARQQAGIFGLIYVDLDEFKQVNDLYGHHLGDLYLREVSQRMKRQLRPGDLLGRLGGDEFAALIGPISNRAEIAEIAHRLEHCFDEPFILDGTLRHGSASLGISLYPEDGATKDDLLNAADAQMYAAKDRHRQIA